MHDGKFIEGAMHNETDEVLEALGISEGKREPEILGINSNVVPSVRHTVITYGVIHKLSRDKLPYVNQFGHLARQFWGRELTVASVREITEELSARVNRRLFDFVGSNYEILPVAQFYSVGSELATRLVRQAYYSEKYIALPESFT